MYVILNKMTICCRVVNMLSPKYLSILSIIAFIEEKAKLKKKTKHPTFVCHIIYKVKFSNKCKIETEVK